MVKNASIELTTYFPCEKKTPPLHILTVAELHWRNGHEYALQALQLLQRRGFPFEYRLVGDGNFLEAAAFARHELGLESHVRLILQAGFQELQQHFAWAEVFLLAPVARGAGHGLNQALSRGIPVVVSDVFEVDQEVSSSRGIYIVPRRDPEALAGCLTERPWCANHGRPHRISAFSLKK